MKVTVSGSGGLIGRAVCAYLTSQGCTLVGVDRIPKPSWFEGQWIQLELSRDPLARCFDGVEALVHLAAIPSPGHVSDENLFANNVTSTFNLLNGAALAGIRRIVIASSLSIYGFVWAERELTPLVLPLREDQALHIEDAYALSKQVDENTALMLSRKYEISIIALRFPNDSDQTDIARRSEEVRQDSRFAHRELWAYLELTEAARAVYAALTAEIEGFHAINVVSDQPLANLDIAKAVTEIYPGAIFEQPPSPSTYDTTRARDLLGFQARKVL